MDEDAEKHLQFTQLAGESDEEEGYVQKAHSKKGRACLGVFLFLVIAGLGSVVGLYFANGDSLIPGGGGGNPDPHPHPQPQPSERFSFFNGLVAGGDWFWFLDVNVNVSFVSTVPEAVASAIGIAAMRIQVDWGDHYAIQLYGSPKFQKDLDDRVRAWNPNASYASGTSDQCGWPDDPNGEPQFRKRTACFYEDFAEGYSVERINIAQVKGCCSRAPVGSLSSTLNFKNGTQYPFAAAEPWQANMGMEAMDVEYPYGTTVRKNVLRLTSINKDNEQCNEGPSPGVPGEFSPLCHKAIESSGVIQTSDIYASARYDVVAKVPGDSGLVFAVWTFHYEEHIPRDCSEYSCYVDGFRGGEDFPPANTPWEQCCPLDCCTSLDRNASRPAHCPTWEKCPCCHYVEGERSIFPCCYKWYRTSSCAPVRGADLCYKDDFNTDLRIINHCNTKDTPDPQFMGNMSIAGFVNQVNHEIDIEIPANCLGTSVCGEAPLPCTMDEPEFCNFTRRESTGCIKRFNTVNLNNYLVTKNSGTGPAYANMCVAINDNATGTPYQLMGDGKWHKYTIDWHTGDEAKGETARVDFYVDDIFIGSNNVMVPTRASRLVIGSWAGGGEAASGPKQNPQWANYADDWGGVPGDGIFYLSHLYISEIKIQPHDEANDIVYPMTFDQPEGCNPNFASSAKYPNCHKHWTTDRKSVPHTIDPVVEGGPRGSMFKPTCDV